MVKKLIALLNTVLAVFCFSVAFADNSGVKSLPYFFLRMSNLQYNASDPKSEAYNYAMIPTRELQMVSSLDPRFASAIEDTISHHTPLMKLDNADVTAYNVVKSPTKNPRDSHAKLTIYLVKQTTYKHIDTSKTKDRHRIFFPFELNASDKDMDVAYSVVENEDKAYFKSEKERIEKEKLEKEKLKKENLEKWLAQEKLKKEKLTKNSPVNYPFFFLRVRNIDHGVSTDPASREYKYHLIPTMMFNVASPNDPTFKARLNSTISMLNPKFQAKDPEVTTPDVRVYRVIISPTNDPVDPQATWHFYMFKTERYKPIDTSLTTKRHTIRFPFERWHFTNDEVESIHRQLEKEDMEALGYNKGKGEAFPPDPYSIDTLFLIGKEPKEQDEDL